MSNEHFNDGVLNSSYALEFRNGQTTENIVSFSIPPQSEEFEYPQRINETKTFGGIVYDDYGNDSVKINLSGTTVNNEIRLIYTGTTTGNSTEVNGEQEIDKITTLIRNYGKKDKLKNKSVYLYKIGDSEINKFWRVLIKDFQVKKSKDKPMSYNYTLQMIGLSDNETQNKNISTVDPITQRAAEETTQTVEAVQQDITDTAEEVNEIIGGTTEKLEETSIATGNAESTKKKFSLDSFFGKVKEFSDKVNKLKTDYSDLFKNVNEYTNLANKVLSETGSIMTETQGLVDSVYDTTVRATLGNALSIWQSCEKLLATTKDFVTWGRSYLDSEKYEALWDSYSISFTETYDDIKDYISTCFGLIEEKTDSLITEVKKTVNDTQIVTVPGKSGESDTVITTYGYFKYIVNDGDTWDSIAYKFFGDANVAAILGAYNDTVKELTVGLEIFIPYFYPKDYIYNNNVINNPDKKDNYGTDISGLDDKDGDFKKVSGVDNLNQSIEKRLSTSIETRVRVIAYGIRNQIGNPFISASYICSSIKETLLADTRIASVDSITYKGEGDKLNVTVVYTDINAEQNTYSGVV